MFAQRCLQQLRSKITCDYIITEQPATLAWKAQSISQSFSQSGRQGVCPTNNVSNLRSTPAFCLQCVLRGQSSDLSLGPVYHRDRLWDRGLEGREEGRWACFQTVTSGKAPMQSQWPVGDSTVRRARYKKSGDPRQHREREERGSFPKTSFDRRRII